MQGQVGREDGDGAGEAEGGAEGLAEGSTIEEQSPSGHGLHSVAAGSAAYVPGSHGTQCWLPGPPDRVFGGQGKHWGTPGLLE